MLLAASTPLGVFRLSRPLKAADKRVWCVAAEFLAEFPQTLDTLEKIDLNTKQHRLAGVPALYSRKLTF